MCAQILGCARAWVGLRVCDCMAGCMDACMYMYHIVSAYISMASSWPFMRVAHNTTSTTTLPCSIRGSITMRDPRSRSETYKAQTAAKTDLLMPIIMQIPACVLMQRQFCSFTPAPTLAAHKQTTAQVQSPIPPVHISQSPVRA